MNESVERVLEQPIGTKLGILGGSVGAIILVFYFMIYSGVATELDKVTKKIDGKNGLNYQIAQQEAIAANIEKFTKEVAVLDIELTKALAELPDKKEVGILLEKVSTKAHDAGLDVKLFKPKPVIKKDFYAEVPVEIEVSGTYHELATFFDEVGRLERIVNMGQFKLSEPQVSDERVDLKTQVVATAFRFLDESERPKEDAGKGSKRRGAKGEEEPKGKKRK